MKGLSKMNKDSIVPEPIELSDKQKLRLFKLILKNTLYKRIEWIYTGVMFSGRVSIEKNYLLLRQKSGYQSKTEIDIVIPILVNLNMIY